VLCEELQAMYDEGPLEDAKRALLSGFARAFKALRELEGEQE